MKKRLVKSLVCQWCKSLEIRLVPVSSLVNLKPKERPYYQKLWQQGWPTKLDLSAELLVGSPKT